MIGSFVLLCWWHDSACYMSKCVTLLHHGTTSVVNILPYNLEELTSLVNFTDSAW